MLTQVHKGLIGLLVAQLVLMVIVLTRGDDSAALTERPLLAGFDAAKVTRLQVLSSGGKPVDVVKRDAGWVVASSFDYPADAARVTDVLTPITKLAAAAPIATQAGRHKQLRVADPEFERKLIITADGKDVTLYIGSAAGARRTAVRLGGSDDVYAVTGISVTTAGSEPRQWVDPGYVKIAREDIARLVVQRGDTTVELSRSATPGGAPGAAGSGSAAGAGSGSAAGAGSGSAAGSGEAPAAPAPDRWYASINGAPVTPAAGETIDEAALDRIAGAASTIDLNAPADPKRDASKPTATITIERKLTGASAPGPTVIDVIADGESYWVHDRSLPRAVLVDKARLDEVVNLERGKLVKKPEPPKPATPPGPPGLPPELEGAMPMPPPGMRSPH